jgi:hypothetical protein
MTTAGMSSRSRSLTAAGVKSTREVAAATAPVVQVHRATAQTGALKATGVSHINLTLILLRDLTDLGLLHNLKNCQISM